MRKRFSINAVNAVGRLFATLIFALYLAILPAMAFGRDKELVVSAAMSLRGAFEEIAKEYENNNLGVKVVMNFSSSGKLRQQIEAGAPVDIFASASKKHMDILEKSGHVMKVSRRDFAGNSIVLATHTNRMLTGFDGLISSKVRRIAMGNPDTSPAGRYAKETLVSLGLWSKIRDKLVFVETVRQVLDYISRDEVDAGLLYATDAALNRVSLRVVEAAPVSTHAAIVYPIAIVSDSMNGNAAESFIELVISPYGGRALEGKRFVIPDE